MTSAHRPPPVAIARRAELDVQSRVRLVLDTEASRPGGGPVLTAAAICRSLRGPPAPRTPTSIAARKPLCDRFCFKSWATLGRSKPGNPATRRRQIPVSISVHSQVFCSRFWLSRTAQQPFCPVFLAQKGPYFAVTLISNTSNCSVFGTLISTPFQCLITYISKHLSRSPPFPPRREAPPVVASRCSVDRKLRVPQRSLVGTSAGGNVPQNVNYFCLQISPDTNSPVQAQKGPSPVIRGPKYP